jgi:hypothetical protein
MRSPALAYAVFQPWLDHELIAGPFYIQVSLSDNATKTKVQSDKGRLYHASQITMYV